MKTYWVTSYVLTQGILEVRGEVSAVSPSVLVYRRTGGLNGKALARGKGKGWHESLEDARARAFELRRNKIASLRRQIDRLESKVLRDPVRVS